MSFTPNLIAASIGSMPHTKAHDAVDISLSQFRELPFWPQLPKRSYYENMYAQISENMPGAVVDPENKKIFIDTSEDFEQKLEIFYTKYLEEDLDYFSISENYANGLFEFKRRLPESGAKDCEYVKGHVVGPASFALTVCDQNKQSVYYNEMVLDAALKLIASKARWQIRFLKELSKEVVIFLDEPYLTSIGSAYVNIKKDKVIDNINEIIGAIHSEGGIAGVHCCGNTDWSIIASTKTDIISFDAYNYADTILLYPDAIRAFIDRGGVLAWGIVPTDSKVKDESKESLAGNLKGWFDKLEEKNINRDSVIKQSMVTPSCGTGSLDEELSKIVLELTSDVSALLRSKP